MQKADERIIIAGSQEDISLIYHEIKAQQASEAEIMQRKNLDGATATWIVIATLANQALPHVLNFLKGKKVTRVKVGDIEVEHPTRQMLEDLEKAIKKRLSANHSTSDTDPSDE